MTDQTHKHRPGDFGKDDLGLGMDKPITRREFVQGAAVALGAAFIPWTNAAGFVGLGVDLERDDPHHADEHGTCVPTMPSQELDARTQNRMGRHVLLGMSFENYERAIRRQLNVAFGAGGFDAARQPFGRVRIANSDAEAFAYVNSAIESAWRAVNEIQGNE